MPHKKIFSDPELFQEILYTSADGIVIIDEKAKIIFCNTALEKIFGYKNKELIGKNLGIIVPKNYPQHGKYIEHYAHHGSPRIMGAKREIHGLHKNGNIIDIEVGISKIKKDGKYTLVGIVRDISEKKNYEKKLMQMALYDNLTGLLNRQSIDDYLERSVARAERYGKSLSVMFIDLDKFKVVNDKYGHEVGDALLTRVALRLKKDLRKSDTIGRIGGDEFIVIMEEMKNKSGCEAVAKKILKSMRKPFNINPKITLVIGASIGIARHPDDGKTPEELVKKADQAMYFAKKNRKGFHFA